MCERQKYEGGAPCPSVAPGEPWRWCPSCRHEQALDDLEAWAAAWPGIPDAGPSHVAGEAPDEPPCPLDLHQQLAYQSWLPGLAPAGWSLDQLVTPSRN